MLATSEFEPESPPAPLGNIPYALLGDAIVLGRICDLLALRRLRRAERRKRLVRNLAGFWPVAVGLVLACAAPLWRDMLLPFHPWGMRLIFPYAVLSASRELHLSGAVAGILPRAMLYAQFPIEGLLARAALKGRVTLRGVAIQIFFLHLLGVAEILFVSGQLG